MLTLTPKISTTPNTPPDYNVSMAETFSWIPIENNANRPLYARAGYITNLSDINVSLSAGNLSIGSVAIKDGNSNREADVESIGNGLNALRVLTQALNSQSDSITIGDKQGNTATVNSATSSLNVNVTSPVIATIDPSTDVTVNLANSSNFDSFSRLRTSSPYTLFDSSHRYSDNGLWSTSSSNGGTTNFNPSQGLIDLTVTGIGSKVTRETIRTFAYQPGKSLLVMNTFVMAPSASGLVQRVGYYNSTGGPNNRNGIYFQLEGGQLAFVKESTSVSPSTQVIPRSNWSEDKLDGTGPSGYTLDITKSHILWMDFEWLGAGTVRCGFVIEGKFIVCHKLHHANVVPSTYIGTACLPITYEITNVSAPAGTYTLKQICSTVLSEGGYELRGQPYEASTPIGTARDLTIANQHYPVVSLRLKNYPTVNRKDAIAILSHVSVLGITNNSNYQWKIVSKGTTTGGSWISDPNSSVEYNITGTNITGGTVLTSGFTVGSNQGSTPVDISKDDLFKYQLERNSFNNTVYEITLCVASDNAGSDVYASINWEEITR